MRSALFVIASLFVFIAAPRIVAAQEAGIRTALSIVPGAVFNTADAGPSVGGSITVDVSPRFALEGMGSYVDRGSGAHALTVQGGVLANLVNGDRRAVPFITAGAGVYFASFDLAAQRFFGGAGPFGPGMSVCAGTGECPYGNLPAFYGRRLGAVVAPLQGNKWPTRTFTDPAFHLGVGARLHVTPHVFVRPEFSGLFVAANRHVQSLGVTSVAFGYRF